MIFGIMAAHERDHFRREQKRIGFLDFKRDFLWHQVLQASGNEDCGIKGFINGALGDSTAFNLVFKRMFQRGA